MDTKELILKAFSSSEEALKVGQILEITGLEKKEVDKVIKALKNEGVIYSPKRCFYEISK